MKIISSLFLLLVASCAFLYTPTEARIPQTQTMTDVAFDGTKVTKTNAQWKRLLTPAQYTVLRKDGTEAPYSHSYTKLKAKGTFHCAACKLAVFSSENKYDSKTGWPSFYQPIAAANVTESEDTSNAMETRTEITCSRCGGHLGHVFKDGPEPTGLRYCMNGVALKFMPAAGSGTATKRRATARRS